ncbi:hypothetical protein ACG83_38800 [Frankia sp. R43]|nr:hypothetical protein ACG83_38800 [Frankia sp. R43]
MIGTESGGATLDDSFVQCSRSREVLQAAQRFRQANHCLQGVRVIISESGGATLDDSFVQCSRSREVLQATQRFRQSGHRSQRVRMILAENITTFFERISIAFAGRGKISE